MNTVEAVLLGILIGVVLGLIWSDTVGVVRIAMKHKHHDPVREVITSDLRVSFREAIPRWLLVVTLVSSLSLVIVGGAQLWQYNQFSDYQKCVEDRDAVQSQAQTLRTADAIKRDKALGEWLQSIVPVFNEGSTPAEFATFRSKTRDVAEAQKTYLETVQDNPYPKPVQEQCGSVDKGGEAG